MTTIADFAKMGKNDQWFAQLAYVYMPVAADCSRWKPKHIWSRISPEQLVR